MGIFQNLENVIVKKLKYPYHFLRRCFVQQSFRNLSNSFALDILIVLYSRKSLLEE